MINSNSLFFSRATTESWVYGYFLKGFTNGEFDIRVRLSEISPFASRSVYGGLRLRKLSDGSSSIYVNYNWNGFSRNYSTNNNSYITTNTTATLRLTRDAVNVVRAYVWNSVLSRWEWNGDVNGRNCGTLSGYVAPFLRAATSLAATASTVVVRFDDFDIWSGCSGLAIPLETVHILDTFTAHAVDFSFEANEVTFDFDANAADTEFSI